MSGTITDFLLARITEDETAATLVSAADAAPTFTGSVYPHDGERFRVNLADRAFSPARVLAECEAKRQQIALFANHPGADPHDDHRWNEYAGMYAMLACLLLPYADHPDYDEAWRL